MKYNPLCTSPIQQVYLRKTCIPCPLSSCAREHNIQVPTSFADPQYYFLSWLFLTFWISGPWWRISWARSHPQQLRHQTQAFKPCWAQPCAHGPAIACGRRKGQPHSEVEEKEILDREDMVTSSYFLKWASATKRLELLLKTEWTFSFLLIVHFCVGGLTGFEVNSRKKIFPVNEKLLCWGKTRAIKIGQIALKVALF